MGKFITGKTYTARSVFDHDCIISITVARRTAKTITTTDGKTLRISTDDTGAECVKPWGSFSMAPVVRA